MIYGAKLKYLRESELMTQEDISHLIGVDQSTYQHYESEYATIPLKYLNVICNYFNISIDYVLGFTDVKQYTNSKKEIDKNYVGKRLKNWRKQNKITLKDLEKQFNTAYSTFSHYERGRSLISTVSLYDICYTYHVSADYLLGKIETERKLDLENKPKFK